MASSDCTRLFEEVQKKLDSTMPWIGLYIAAATAACTFAMAADAFIGFRCKRYWLPSKCFSLNAFSLTILAVTMKLPVDLTSTDLSSVDQYARISSLVFMSICMSNFMTSLGSMENNEILLNIAALGVLVITITVNVCIHIVQMRPFISDVFYMFLQQIASLVIMLLFLAMLCCVSLMLPSAKRYIELKYNEMHKLVSNRQLDESFDEIGNMVKGYWVMAETGNPQFVMARSAISSTSGLLSLLTVVLSVEVLHSATHQLSSSSHVIYCPHSISNYSWSIKWILKIQFLGVAVGSFASLLRWFIAWTVKVPEMERRKCFRDELKVDKYWTLMLVEWRDRSLPFHVQNRVCKKLLFDAVRFVLNLCIGVQILFVLAAKLVLFLSARLGNALLLCFCKNCREGESKSRDAAQVDFSQYVLLLEGEPQLPDKIVKNICKEADRLIQIGEKKQPKNLIRLLKKSANFNGVVGFDSSQVPSLHYQEPPNCWTLPVVTLTTISVAFTNNADDKANQLLASVSEGLSIVKLIEKTIDGSGELESIRKAADVVWIGVEVYRKWDDTDLRSTSVRGATNKETLQNLSDIGDRIVTEFMAQTRDILMQNPVNWPTRVIAANSMYRITQTILLGMGDDEELFESISITISDILAACLTNLVKVIQMKCHRNNVKERQQSVKRAAILLGESKEIREILQQRELPSLDVDKAATIDEWRASMALDIENPCASPSASLSASSGDATIVVG